VGQGDERCGNSGQRKNSVLNKGVVRWRIPLLTLERGAANPAVQGSVKSVDGAALLASFRFVGNFHLQLLG
jgi:hypothetical protein